MDLQALSRETLRDRIHDLLRAAILNGQLPPGQRLIEEELAQRLGVSRGPLREAIRHLEHEGLLTTLPNRGTYVIKLSVDDAREVYLLRAVLEGLAAMLVTDSIDPDTLNTLTSLANQMVDAARGGELDRMADLDYQFHQRLVQSSGHRRLEKAWTSMQAQIRPIARRALDHESVDAVSIARHHTYVVDAIRSAKKEEARRLVEQHIVQASQRAVAVLRRQQEGAKPG